MPGLTSGDVLQYLHDSAALRRTPVLIILGVSGGRAGRGGDWAQPPRPNLRVESR
jgi:hypothetical protein